MSDLFEFIERPDIKSPVLVMALDGWIDAGLGAQRALEAIRDQTDTIAVASFDADRLLDHRARRPTMELVDGVHRSLTWPEIRLDAAVDGDGSEFLLLSGAEPDHIWQAFSQAVIDLAFDFGASLLVGLGAYPAPVPHTRATGLASTATSRELADRVGFVQGSIAVPAGVQAAIEDRAGTVGIPAAGLWAQVPHYAAAMPYPAAAEALLEGLEHLTGLTFDREGLAVDAQEARERLDRLVADSEEHTELITQLEVQVDAQAEADNQPLPTGDELAEELQRFLREQGDG